MYETITLEQVIMRAKGMFRIENTDDDAWFYIWAEEAIRSLDTFSFYVKNQCVIQIRDDKAKLPKGLVRILAVWWDCFNVPVYVDLPYLKLCDCNVGSLSNYRTTMQINKGHLLFYNLPSVKAIDPITGAPSSEPTTPTEANIAYIGYNLDENGEPVIYERYERAVWNYCCWMYSLQNGINGDVYHRQWIASKKAIRSGDQREQFRNTKRQVGEWYNAWLTDKTQYL